MIEPSRLSFEHVRTTGIHTRHSVVRCFIMTYSFRLSISCDKMGTQGPAMTRTSSPSPNWVPSPTSKSLLSDAKCCNPTRPFSAIRASSSVAGGGHYSSGSGELVYGRKEGRRRKIAGIDQEELVDPQDLADSDSCFCEFNGVQIHHKVYDPLSVVGDGSSHSQGQTSSEQSLKLGFPMILLHGFGASVFSWNLVMKPLAEVIGSKVLAFDRPAFGLTSRVNLPGHSKSLSSKDDTKPLNPYSMAFSVLATLYFIDSLTAEKAILVGHSAGSVVALNTYFEAPERVAALILVAPAIFTPRASTKPGGVRTTGGNNNKEREDSVSSDMRNPFHRTFGFLYRFIKCIAKRIMQIVKVVVDTVNSVFKKAISAFLRSALAVTLMRMVIDKFGTLAVKNAFYDTKQVSEHVLVGYTKPLRVKDWDRALVEFTATTLLQNGSGTKPPLEKRLHEISCPVLIVTGDTDRIVPAWNAKRLAEVIPGSTLEVIKKCGHIPHEERVEEFVSAVKKFLRKSFGGSEHSLEAVTC